ncbi:MAG: sarcosine oxidase subunit alpha family protein [Geminicoccaceae bacterium]
MSQAYRLTEGGQIDRSRSLGFSFDGRTLEGHPGDTLASALLANGIHLVGRSFKYHRPRGVLGAGAEEPNALVQLEQEEGRSDPNLRATQIELFDGLDAESQNRWPSLTFDVGAVNSLFSPLLPAGFYYKTFMWPAAFWKKVYEPNIRAAAGLGRAPASIDPDWYEHRHVHCDILIVGGGPAGLAAAVASAGSEARVILCDQDFAFGGELLSEPDRAIGDGTALDWIKDQIGRLRASGSCRLLSRTTCFGYYDHNMLALVERVQDHLPASEINADLPRQRVWFVRAKRVVLATGAIERPLVFDGNDRPGVMLTGAARTYARRYGVMVGRQAVIATNNDGAYPVALDLAEQGVRIEAIVDSRSDPDKSLVAAAETKGISALKSHVVVDTGGGRRVHTAFVAPLAEDGINCGYPRPLPVDCLLMSGGWNPAIHLFSQSRGKLRFEDARGIFLPESSPQPVAVAGAANGTEDLAGCLAEGQDAGARAARELGFEPPPPALASVAGDPVGVQPLWRYASRGGGKAAFVDFQNDVKVKDLDLALREGFQSVEHVKRYTTTGMGTDQGKTSNVNALAVVAASLGQAVSAVGTTTFRPPYTPVTFGAIVGQNRRGLFDPVRTTPMHQCHVEAGAAFEAVGQWRRAWFYPKPDEDMAEAVQREALAARTSAGLFDASTLGKIDLQGPDARTLLNRVYTNGWSKLEAGRCRYGLMLGDDGMIMDDGVTTCLADDHFHMTTTTGGAARILAWLEEWLQTEWPDLRVYATSVTEQWAVVSLSGPKARAILAPLTDLDLSAEAFPHMSLREGSVADLPARVYRISFTGETGFEINVPARHGAQLWHALTAAGQAHDLTPYGTETMHLLRAEKGYIITGQDTDGTATPLDMGMGWIVSSKKGDFIGKRSLSRPDMTKPDRKQFVGLKTKEPMTVLEEGAQIVAVGTDASATPVPMIGHVTSSYMSPILGRSIALAMVRGGRSLEGETVLVPMADRVIEAEITSPVFLDPAGERLQ